MILPSISTILGFILILYSAYRLVNARNLKDYVLCLFALPIGTVGTLVGLMLLTP